MNPPEVDKGFIPRPCLFRFPAALRRGSSFLIPREESFLISSASVAVLHAATGLLGLYGVSLPGMPEGNYPGTHLYGRLKDAHDRRVILCLPGLLRAFMIYRTP